MRWFRNFAAGLGLVVFGFAAAPGTAHACVIYDGLGRNICNPPKYDMSEMARKSFEQMAAECAATPITGSDLAPYSIEDLSKAILSLGLISNRIRAADGVMDPNFATPAAEISALAGSIGALQACQYKYKIIDNASRAFDSCKALQREVEALDTAAKELYDKGALTSAEWVRSLELFLPAAKKCRRTLGLCYNPNSATQTAAAMALVRLQVSLQLTSNDEAQLYLKLPACTRTMLDAKLYDPKNGTEAIRYINSIVDDEFVSFDGEMREEGK